MLVVSKQTVIIQMGIVVVWYKTKAFRMLGESHQLNMHVKRKSTKTEIWGMTDASSRLQRNGAAESAVR